MAAKKKNPAERGAAWLKQQRAQLETWSRKDLIAWCMRNDPNGDWSEAEEEDLSKEDLVDEVMSHVEENEETPGELLGRGRRGNPRKATRLRWVPFYVGGRPNSVVKKATDLRSGAYAIRTKRGRGVVYVGESRQGHMWRTINRHFQAPKTFTEPKRPGGGNSFATDRPEDYEVAWRVTSKGYRGKPNADQSALNLQAAWIEDFRAAGHALKNRDDGKAWADEHRAHRAKQQAEDDARPWYENPSAVGRLVSLGRLTKLEVTTGKRKAVLRWNLRDAPLLAFDAYRRLHVFYRRGTSPRPISDAELKEYEKLHWGQGGDEEILDGGLAPAPYRLLGSAAVVTYTTKKGRDEKLVDYVHPFEGEKPRIIEHRCKGGCAPKCAARGAIGLSGGTYKLQERGIVG